MACDVLEEPSQYHSARRAMRLARASALPPNWLCTALRRFGLGGFLYGDIVKSWDVWKTALFLQEHVAKDSPVIDFGAYHSEILPVLNRLGFTCLHGIDLNPRVLKGRYRSAITYRVADFYRTPFDDKAFEAITAISSIEHGLDLRALFQEVGRLLRPGGYFVFSTDYWPQKIDTTGLVVCGMPWKIFSRQELADAIALAGEFGLTPVGDVRLSAAKPVITHANRHYTFAWVVLSKERFGSERGVRL